MGCIYKIWQEHYVLTDGLKWPNAAVYITGSTTGSHSFITTKSMVAPYDTNQSVNTWSKADKKIIN